MQTNELYDCYEHEILYLRKQGSKLLQKIKWQEIKMNQRRQRRLKPLLRQVNLLHQMMKKLLKISAFIDTYKYFQKTQVPFTDKSEPIFYEMITDYYQKALIQIVLKLKQINCK